LGWVDDDGPCGLGAACVLSAKEEERWKPATTRHGRTAAALLANPRRPFRFAHAVGAFLFVCNICLLFCLDEIAGLLKNLW
jgi:hypothetical protein